MDQIAEQPLGEPVDFTGANAPSRIEHHGRYALLRPLQPERDAAALYAASHAPTGDPTIWTYLYEDPFPSLHAFQATLEQQAASSDPLFFTVARADDGKPLGVMSYLSIVPEHGTIEIGHIWFGPELKRTPAATDAIYLLARHAFDDLGYRRLEWKCNALNAPSRNAALRFGFQFEGIFLNHRVVKRRNRDTAWFAITDSRWPAVRAAFETWLSPTNFEQSGAQRTSLRNLTAS
ncbi:MAG TPA: GNAT family protein [Solirubrobacteraceae bacterium]|jgi:RimJ/RimL family protein N-acetyltransferase|nr:GNAT family protein [Solirubrobacteraceae bacterium]